MGRPLSRAGFAGIRLTSTVECAGCAAKIAPGDLKHLIERRRGSKSSPRVLVGPETWDDAGVYKLSATEALVQTVDFFTPIVDSPRDFGAIAAANAVSDVYAMGGIPETALCILAAPVEELPAGVVGEIIRGGEEVMREAGVAILGGHSIRDKELKFGYAVTGRIHPKKVVTNAGARAGDVLVLTKPLGTGVLTTALKRQLLGAADLKRVTAQMRRLNAGAARAMVRTGVHAATDVTGFGLLGHARNVAAASKVTLEFDSARVPLLPGIEDFLLAGCYPGGLVKNAAFLAPFVEFKAHVPEVLRKAVVDPQTSGGLLIAVPAARLGKLLAELKREKTPAFVVGRALPRSRRALLVV